MSTTTQADQYRRIAHKALDRFNERAGAIWFAIGRAALALASLSEVTNQRTLATDLHEDR